MPDESDVSLIDPPVQAIRIFQPESGARPESASVKLTVANLCKKPLDLSGRKPIKAYAIDGANPMTPMDRDDAVNVEFHEDLKLGKLVTLHVTIADVASVSPGGANMHNDPRLAALDAHAAGNGETLYFSHGVAPMLPRSLQDRLSLEDGKERAGLTISITFDSKCQPIHTEFSKTRVTTQCKSYRGAAVDIQQHGHPIQQIAVLADQLLKNKRGLTNLPYYNKETGFYTDSEGNERHVSPDELSAYTMVQGCMIAANEAAASMMQGSNFLFRNHSFLFTPKGGKERVVYSKAGLAGESGEPLGKLEPNNAAYSATNIGHFGLDSVAYSHVTSPIRRYADLVNQRMMHWAIDVVDSVVQSVMKSGVGADEDKVRYVVWEHAPELLEKASHYKQEARGPKKMRLRHELDAMIATTVKQLHAVPASKIDAVVEQAVEDIQAKEIPYKHGELDKVAAKLNGTISANRERRRDFSETTAWMNTVFPNTDAQLLREWSATSFGKLLEAAARRGDNNDVFAAQVRERIAMGMKAYVRHKKQHFSDAPNPEKALEELELAPLVQNLHSIIVVAEQRKDGHWEELKHFAFEQLKGEPELAEKLFEYMQVQQLKSFNSVLQAPMAECSDDPLLVRETRQSYVVEATLFDSQRHSYPAALVVLNHERMTPGPDGTVLSHDQKDYSAPVIDAAIPSEHASLAEATKVARQSAILTFFRYYGKMYHHEDLYTPPLIEMELERAKVKKGDRLEFLQKIGEGLFTVECSTRPAPPSAAYIDYKTVVATVRVKTLSGETIITEAIGPEERALDKAANKMFFNRTFRDMLSLSHDPVEMPGEKMPDSELEPRLVWGKIIEFDRRALSDSRPRM